MIHRTGKRALHKSRKYSVAIEAIEMEENDEAAEIKTNDDDHATVSNFMHDMCDFSIIIDFYFYALGEKKRRKPMSSYHHKRRKLMLEKLWKQEQSLSLYV